MNINITTNGNKKLLTRNKYCREDININTQVASSVNLFEYYKTLAMASCDITEKIPSVTYNNFKIALYFTLTFEGNWSDDPTFSRYIILKSTDYESSEDNYCTIEVSGLYDDSSGTGHYTCSYKSKTGNFIEFASGAVSNNIPGTSNPAVTLALNVWCKNKEGFVVSNTTDIYPIVYVTDFANYMSQKQVTAWGNLKFQNVPMNVKIGN